MDQEQVITTKTGTYGFITVTIPMTIKDTMVKWYRQSGMRKTEFFRVSLMMGERREKGWIFMPVTPDRNAMLNLSHFTWEACFQPVKMENQDCVSPPCLL